MNKKDKKLIIYTIIFATIMTISQEFVSIDRIMITSMSFIIGLILSKESETNGRK